MNHESLVRDVTTLRRVIVAVENRNKMQDSTFFDSYNRQSTRVESKMQDKQNSNYSIHDSDRFEEDDNLALIVDNFEAIKCVVERMEKISTFNNAIEYIVIIGAGIVTITLCLRFLF